MTFLRHLLIALTLAACLLEAPIVPLSHAILPPVTNFAKVIVSTGYSSAVTSIVLLSGHGAKLPATFPFPLSWWNCTDFSAPEDDPFVEIISVTARTTDTLTVVRAQDGTSAQNHNTGSKTYCMVLSITKAMWDAVRTDIAAAAGGASKITSGTNSPEGAISKPVGDLYLRTDSWSGVNVLYQKVSGTGNTGWLAVPNLSSPGPIGLTSASDGSFTTLSALALTSTLFNFVSQNLTYGPTVTIDANAATVHKLTVTNGTAFSISNPTNPSTGRWLVIRFVNTSGGVMATPSFDTLYKMPSFATVKPATGFQRWIYFMYDGTNWIEMLCSPEVPN